jgi:hypothetical protein
VVIYGKYSGRILCKGYKFYAKDIRDEETVFGG